MQRGISVAVLMGTMVAAAAGSQNPAGSATSDVTFTRNVLPVLQKNCQSCHRPGQIAPMSLISYDQVRPYARTIKTKVMAREMPPWFADPRYGHFSNDRSLKESDIDTLVKWVDGGAVKGN